MSAIMYVQQIIIFITVCTETRGAEKRIKTRAAKASAYQWWRGGTDSMTRTKHTQHIFDMHAHTPITQTSSSCTMFSHSLLSGEAV